MIKNNIEFIKKVGTVLLINATLYFLVKLISFTPHMMTPNIKFPLIKEFVYIYNSWYPFIILNLFIIFKHDNLTFNTCIKSIIISVILAEITYIIYPTIISRPNITVNNLTTFILNLTYTLDTPALNCFPSSHCLICFILIYYTLKTKNIKNFIKAMITIYLILIILSTLFISQHLLIDVIGALCYASFSLLITKCLLTLKRANH